jgi:predicted metal-dependent HD superfamily phosphohydrolase
MASANSEGLREKWRALLARLGLSDPRVVSASFVLLEGYYSEADRHYHNLTHIAAVLATLEDLCAELAHPEPVFLAGWFHDLIYDSKAGDNEARSAEAAFSVLSQMGVNQADIEETARLILLTRTHDVKDADAGGCALCDADLAILGATAAEYDDYAAAIRQEYAWVPEERYRAGRAEVLEGFLKRPRIYHTAKMAGREEQARANLRREIAVLS